MNLRQSCLRFERSVSHSPEAGAIKKPMRRLFPIALVILGVATLLISRPVLAQLAKGPRLILTKVIPHYPDLARPMRLEGTVKLTVTVAANGSVKSVEAVGGHPLLLKAAQDAIYKWKWAAAPEESQELIELRFHPD